MKDLAMVTWTHSSYNDVFPAYFGNVKKYFKDLESSYVLINSLSENIDDDHLQLVNSENDSYASRWLGSLEHIEEDYILYMQEDFILYDYVDVVELNKCIDYLKIVNALVCVLSDQLSILWITKKKKTFIRYLIVELIYHSLINHLFGRKNTFNKL